jgi:CheY-like chemotaxis protein
MKERIVLLVDDEPAVRKYVKALLQGEGFQTIEAGDGIEAFNLVQEFGKEIDLILTDVKMPRMDGPSLVESVKGLFPKIPVLFMTGYTSPHEMPIRSHVVLSKPFRSQVLIEAIRKLIGTST